MLNRKLERLRNAHCCENCMYNIVRRLVHWCSDRYSVRIDNSLKPLDKYVINENQEEDLQNDKDQDYWSSRPQMLAVTVGLTVGLSNIWYFPSLVWEHGGGAFLLTYLLVTPLFALPLIILEFGLGQFTGRGCLGVCWHAVPIMCGLAPACLALCAISIPPYAVVLTWIYHYLLVSLFARSSLPWAHCNRRHNSIHCLSSFVVREDINNSALNVLSTQEYFDALVIGSNKGSLNSLNELALSQVLMYSLIFMLLLPGLHRSNLFPALLLVALVALFVLLLKVANLPGATTGLLHLLRPVWSRLLRPKAVVALLQYLTFSYSLGYGCLMCLSRRSRFHDNFLRDAVFLCLFEVGVSLVCGLVTHTALGHLSHNSGMPINQVLKSGGPGMLLVLLPSALAPLEQGRMWTIMLLLSSALLGLTSLTVLLETLLDAVMEMYAFSRVSSHKIRPCLLVGLCLICGILSGFIMTSGTAGLSWLSLLMSGYTSIYGPLIIISVEIFTFCFIYGWRKINEDFNMMLGIGFMWYIILLQVILCPIFLLLILLNQIFYDGLKIRDLLSQDVPLWMYHASVCLLCVLLLPIPVGALYQTIILYRRSASFIPSRLLKPSEEYIPQLNCYWVFVPQDSPLQSVLFTRSSTAENLTFEDS